MVLWENFINQVENNRTYMTHNVTARKDKYHDNVYLNTAKYGTEITLTEDFTEVLALPLTQNTTQFVSTTIEGEILGITTINSYFSCFKCNKKLQQSSSATNLECNNYHLKQKLKPSSKHWYAQVLVQYSDNKKITLGKYWPFKTRKPHANHRRFVQSSITQLSSHTTQHPEKC